MKTLVLVGERLPPTTLGEIAIGQIPRIESLELARVLKADVLGYQDVAQAPEPAVVAARLRSPAWGLAALAVQRRDRYEAVYATGEDIGLRLAFLLRVLREPRRITMVVHNAGALSRRVGFPAVGSRDLAHLICLCDRQRRVLIEARNCFPNSVRRLNQWVDTDFFDPSRSMMAGGEEYVLSCGRERRDYPTLQRAAAQVQHPFWVVASGWSSRPGFRPSSGIEATDNVRVDRGTLSFGQLRDAYHGARFVVVAVEAVEYAAGVSTICEAMAMGKAIVATASPGIAEYLEDQVTGLVVPSGDAESMARAIDELWRNPDQCEEMGRHNRRQAETAFSLDSYVSSVADLMSGSESQDPRGPYAPRPLRS